MQISIFNLLSFVLPVFFFLSLLLLTAVSLKSSQPKIRSTEWILREISPEPFAPPAFQNQLISILLSFCAAVVGFGMYTAVRHFDIQAAPISLSCDISAALGVGAAFFLVCRLGGRRIAALLGAVLAFLLCCRQTSSSIFEMLSVIALLFSLSSPISLIASGLLIGFGSVNHAGILVLLVPALAAAVILAPVRHSKLPLLFWFIGAILAFLIPVLCGFYQTGQFSLPAVTVTIPHISAAHIGAVVFALLYLVIHYCTVRSFSDIFLLVLLLTAIPAFLFDQNCSLIFAAAAIGLCGSRALDRNKKYGTIFFILFFVVVTAIVIFLSMSCLSAPPQWLDDITRLFKLNVINSLLS